MSKNLEKRFDKMEKRLQNSNKKISHIMLFIIIALLCRDNQGEGKRLIEIAAILTSILWVWDCIEELLLVIKSRNEE